MENNALVPTPAGVPATLFTPTPKAARRVLEFFTAQINNDMSRSSRRDYLRRIYGRYQEAGRREKQRILDGFCANCS